MEVLLTFPTAPGKTIEAIRFRKCAKSAAWRSF